MVQPRRNIDYNMTVDQNLELADAVLKVVQIKAVEGQ
jgi:hypothetical protein